MAARAEARRSARLRESEPITPGAQRLESKICEGGFGSHRFLRPITGSAKNNPVKVCGPCSSACGRKR
jgi:hypothetical protein